MNGHTKGPWHFYALLSASENHKGYRIQDKAGWIGDCSPRDEDGIEGGANARLIAAAPDLLFCLQQIVSALPKNRDWLDPDLERMAAGTIAKATQP